MSSAPVSGFTILDALELFGGAQFRDESWRAWRAVLKATFALPMDHGERRIYRALTGRRRAPTKPARELWAVCGRRAGKSIVASAVAVYLTTCRTYDLAAGERGTFMIIAADRRQARTVRRYIGGLLHSTPVLKQFIMDETKEAIELENGVTIEIHTASFRSVRGYTVIGAICDELAYWPTDEAAEPDAEILAALRPAMSTVPGAMLLCLSSPYARRGELFRTHEEHFGKDGDPVLVIQAETRRLNPTVLRQVITDAYRKDESRARAEYGAQFRADVEGLIGAAVVESCTVSGRREIPPAAGTRYTAFVDPSGGSSDSMTLAIAHAHGDHVVLDLAREVRPPFSPDDVTREFCEVLKRYGCSRATGDRYGGEWPRERFREHGVHYESASATKSDLYIELLSALNSRRVELLDSDRLRAQLLGLERRTSRSGRDSVDHPPGRHQHDDVANAAAGALVLALARHRTYRSIRVIDHRFGGPESAYRTDGVDGDGTEWRGGRIWSGLVMPERNGKGQYLSRWAARFHGGTIVEYIDVAKVKKGE